MLLYHYSSWLVGWLIWSVSLVDLVGWLNHIWIVMQNEAEYMQEGTEII
jgi:hypothetical protein